MFDQTFWRTEVWHPLTVHFPVAILLLATIVKIVAVLLREQQQGFWQRAGAYLLYIGFLAAWVSVYTGSLAESIVARKLCDPTVLKDHEIAAFNLAYIFTGATVLELALRFQLLKFKPKLLQVIVVLLMLAGSGFLVYVGHTGASVVYNQAGGVNIPAADCAGF
jgi:uncharacterized membrane protein